MKKNRPIAVTVLLAVLLALVGCATPAWSQGKTVLAKEEMNVVTPIVSRGTTCTDAALTTALTAIGSSEKRLLLSPIDGSGANCTWTIANNLTIPRNVTLVVPQGAKASINTARTLTLNGPLDTDDPAWYSGAGAVVLNYRDWSPDTMVSYIASGCTPTVPGASLTLSTFACRGFINDNGQWYSTFQISSVVGPLNGGDGTYWLALYRDLTATVAGWTRQASTYYLWQKSATQPATPNGGMLFAQVTVAAGAVTVVGYIGNPNPLLSTLVSAGKNVKECGAKVDEVTDDTVALNACLAAYAHVFVPEGVLLHSGTIVLPPGKTLSGVRYGNDDDVTGGHQSGSEVRYAGAGKAISIDAGAGAVRNFKTIIRDLAVRAETGTVGIYIKDGADVLVQNVLVNGHFGTPGHTTNLGFSTACIQIDSTFPSSASIVVHLWDVYAQGCVGDGVLTSGANNNNAITILASRIQANNGWGIRGTSLSKQMTIMGNDIEGNTLGAIKRSADAALLIQNNYFEYSAGPTSIIVIDGAAGESVPAGKFAGGISIIGNFIQANGAITNGILLGVVAYVNGAVITGNFFAGVLTNGINLLAVNDCFVAANTFTATVTTPILGVQFTLTGGNTVVFPGEALVPLRLVVLPSSAVIANTSAETTAITTSIVANSLTGTNFLRLRVDGFLHNATTGPADYTIRLYYGGTLILTIPLTAVAVGDIRYWQLSTDLYGVSNPTAIRGHMQFVLDAPGANQAVESHRADVWTSSVPAVTSTRDLLVTVQMGVASALLTTGTYPSSTIESVRQ